MNIEMKRRGFFKTLFGVFAATHLNPKEILKDAEEKQEEINKILPTTSSSSFITTSCSFITDADHINYLRSRGKSFDGITRIVTKQG